MRHKNKYISATVSISLILLCSSLPAFGEDPYEEHPELFDATRTAAHVALRNRIGTWDSRWEFISPEGDVSRVLTGTEQSNFILDDQVVDGTTIIPEIDFVGRNLNYFHPVERKLFFFSVSKSGDHWILTEEVGSGEMISLPHKEAGGGERIIRFKTLRKTPTEVDVLREDSVDGGATWQPVFKQYLRKQV